MSANSMGKGRMRGLLYIFIFVLLLSSCGLLEWIDPYSADFYFYIAFILALGLGILHIMLGPKFLGVGSSLSFNRGLLLILLILVLSGLVMAVIFYRLNLPYYFISFVVAFALPFFIWHSYRLFIQIPSARYKRWFYPIDERMPDLDMIDLSEIVVVQFVFSKKPEDGKQTNFTSKAPLNMSLGQLFFIFINDYNERNSQQTISYLDVDNQPFGWFFYKEKGWFKKKYYYDPELSFKENGIEPNRTIYVVRDAGPVTDDR